MFAFTFERFRIYRFGFEYPKGCVISFGKESWRRKGYIIMELAGRLRISTSWGELDSIPAHFGTTEAHAKHSLSRLGKATDVKDVDLISMSNVDVNGHLATFTHFTVNSAYPILAKSRNRETRSLHIHCEESNRFFILNESSTINLLSSDAELVFEKLRQTFVCH